MRILLIEDYKDSADLLADLLTEQGHAVTVARDGETAIRAYGAFDVLVLDLHLPDIDGVALGHVLRRLHPKASLVLMSVTQ